MKQHVKLIMVTNQQVRRTPSFYENIFVELRSTIYRMHLSPPPQKKRIDLIDMEQDKLHLSLFCAEQHTYV
jgi:hypothetical protein